MPLYYFDIHDDDEVIGDEHGLELENLYEARNQAIAILSDLARDRLADGNRHVYKVVVKCWGLRVRYVATLTLDGEWVEPPAYAEGDPPP